MSSEFIHKLLFSIFPYIAITVFIIGCIIRYERDQYTWKAGSSQLLRSRWTIWANNLFHVGIILLFFGHLIGLLTPEFVYHKFMTPGLKQILAMTLGGIFGLICFVGISMLLYRRLFDARIRSITTFNDIAILLILYIQLIIGLITIPFSYQHLDGSSMLALANWAQYIVTFRADPHYFVMGQSIVFKIHIGLGLLIIMIFPFTRLVHMLSAPVKYLFRSGYQIVRKRG